MRERGCWGGFYWRLLEGFTYPLRLPPRGIQVLRRVAQSPGEGLAVRDEVAEPARGDDQEADDAEHVHPRAVVVLVLHALPRRALLLDPRLLDLLGLVGVDLFDDGDLGGFASRFGLAVPYGTPGFWHCEGGGLFVIILGGVREGMKRKSLQLFVD